MRKVYKFKREKINELNKYGNISKISRDIGVSREHLSYIVNGHRVSSMLLAKALSEYAGNKKITYYFNEMER